MDRKCLRTLPVYDRESRKLPGITVKQFGNIVLGKSGAKLLCDILFGN